MLKRLALFTALTLLPAACQNTDNTKKAETAKIVKALKTDFKTCGQIAEFNNIAGNPQHTAPLNMTCKQMRTSFRTTPQGAFADLPAKAQRKPCQQAFTKYFKRCAKNSFNRIFSHDSACRASRKKAKQACK